MVYRLGADGRPAGERSPGRRRQPRLRAPALRLPPLGCRTSTWSTSWTPRSPSTPTTPRRGSWTTSRPSPACPPDFSGTSHTAQIIVAPLAGASSTPPTGGTTASPSSPWTAPAGASPHRATPPRRGASRATSTSTPRGPAPGGEPGQRDGGAVPHRPPERGPHPHRTGDGDAGPGVHHLPRGLSDGPLRRGRDAARRGAHPAPAGRGDRGRGRGLARLRLQLPSPSTSPHPRGAAGHPVTVVQAPPTLAEIRRRPSWWGIPLLFPFPGAIPDGEYEFEGRRLRLGREGQPVVRRGARSPRGAAQLPRLRHGRPLDGRRRGGGTTGAPEAQRLPGKRLLPGDAGGVPLPLPAGGQLPPGRRRPAPAFQAHNPGPGPLPCGFGAHPFFRLPLGPGRLARGVPDHHPRGPALGRAAPAHGPAGGSRARGARGRRTRCAPRRPPSSTCAPRARFVEGVFNGLYTDLAREDGWIAASVIDPANRREAVMRGSPGFENVVFWSPPGRAELCLEPWSVPLQRLQSRRAGRAPPRPDRALSRPLRHLGDGA